MRLQSAVALASPHVVVVRADERRAGADDRVVGEGAVLELDRLVDPMQYGDAREGRIAFGAADRARREARVQDVQQVELLDRQPLIALVRAGVGNTQAREARIHDERRAADERERQDRHSLLLLGHDGLRRVAHTRRDKVGLESAAKDHVHLSERQEREVVFELAIDDRELIQQGAKQHDAQACAYIVGAIARERVLSVTQSSEYDVAR